MLDRLHIPSVLSSALALLGLLWVSGIVGRVRNPKKAIRESGLNQGGCPPAEASATATADGNEAWGVPRDIGELTISKLLVHPIKVSL